MEAKIKIEGMMCEHCVARVRKALESVPGVESVSVSLEDKCAIVSGESFEPEAAKRAVYDQGYDLID